MIAVSLILVASSAAAVNPTPTESAMSKFVAALITKDVGAIRRLASPDILYTKSPENGQIPADKTIDALLNYTAKCDVGAALKKYVRSPEYTINWWCDYRDDGEGHNPSVGAFASLGFDGQKIIVSDFVQDIPYGPPIYRVQSK